MSASYINTQATNAYKEALQATENIEAPALGFCRPAEYKGTCSSVTAAIKQSNTQIQLLVTILEKLETLRKESKGLKNVRYLYPKHSQKQSSKALLIR